MSLRALCFRRLELRRGPGFLRDGFEINGFVPGINLIHGPNASGKSTTAAALAALLWPSKTVPASFWLEAEAAIGEESWRISLEASRRAFHSPAGQGLPPGLPPPELGARYMLSLERLLVAEQEPLATELAREAAGGLDLRRAAAAAGFRPKAAPHRDEALELRKLAQRLSELRAEQQRLERQEDDLVGLGRELEACREAGRAAERLGRWLDYLNAEKVVETARAELARTPEWLDRAAGDEHTRLAQLDQRWAEAKAQIEAAEAERQTLEAQCSDLARNPPPTAEHLLELEQEFRHFAELEREVENRERERRAAESVFQQAAAELGKPVDSEQLRRALATAPGRFAELLRAEESLAASRALVDRAGGLLPSTVHVDPARLNEAERNLRRWLTAREEAGPVWSTVATAAAAATLAAIGWLSPLVAAGKLAAGLATLALIAVLARQLVARRETARRLEEYRRADPSPLGPRMGRESAQARLEELATANAEARLELLKSRLRDRLDLNEERLERDRRNVDRLISEVALELGVEPAAGALSLSLLAERLRRLAEAGRDLTAETSRLEAAQLQVEALRQRLADRLNLGGTASLAAAMAAFQSARQRRQTLEEVGQRLGLLEKSLGQTLRPAAQRAASDRRELLAGLGLSVDEAPLLLAKLGELGARRAARQSLHVAERDLAAARAAWAEAEKSAGTSEKSPGTSDSEPPRGAAEIAAERQRLLAEAARQPELEGQAVEIRTRLQDARARHDLEQALLRRDTLRANLAEHRRADQEAVAGWMLAAFLEEQTRNLFQPQVLDRARALFEAITRHRYELRLVVDPAPGFGALDRTTGLALPLESLSSGTRVQLLIAVRLASVESQERGLALPLFFDEALTTSDPERSEALIAAVSAIAAQGRQVFVFTAQPDEVARWEAVAGGLAAEGQPVALATHNLGDIRRLAESSRRPLAPTPARSLPPAPNGLNHHQYGELLAVPAFDPWSPDSSSLHLWHLISDPVGLHRLLSVGFERWGPLRALFEQGASESLFPGAEALLRRAVARARALDAALIAWRAGRGRPVDRAALVASGAVSENFLDEVSSLAAQAEGDAAQILAGLERGAVKGFRAKKIQELASWLEDQGFLDHRPRANGEQIRLAAISAAQRELSGGDLSLAELDGLLTLLT